jgi:hypothetical protein
MEIHELTGKIEEQSALLIAVSVHEKEIGNVQAEYQTRRREIAAELRRLALEDPNPFPTSGTGTSTGRNTSLRTRRGDST